MTASRESTADGSRETHSHLFLAQQQAHHDEAGVETQPLDVRSAAKGFALKVLTQANGLVKLVGLTQKPRVRIPLVELKIQLTCAVK